MGSVPHTSIPMHAPEPVGDRPNSIRSRPPDLLSPFGFNNYADTVTEDVNAAFDAYLRGEVHSKDWAFRVRVLSLAKHAFGHFDKYLMGQYKSIWFPGRPEQFVWDTFQFLVVGRREISIHNWIRLLDYRGQTDHTIPTDDQVQKKVETIRKYFYGNRHKPIQTADVLQKWCERERGFDDMLCTLSIVAGH